MCRSRVPESASSANSRVRTGRRRISILSTINAPDPGLGFAPPGRAPDLGRLSLRGRARGRRRDARRPKSRRSLRAPGRARQGRCRRGRSVRRDPGPSCSAADTVVVVGGRDPRQTAPIPPMRAGCCGCCPDGVHDVLTAVVVRGSGRNAARSSTTRVRFVPLDEAEIALVRGIRRAGRKAGAYAIQGRAARFIDRIEGSWSNVVGLPDRDGLPAAERAPLRSAD